MAALLKGGQRLLEFVCDFRLRRFSGFFWLVFDSKLGNKIKRAYTQTSTGAELTGRFLILQVLTKRDLGIARTFEVSAF